MTDSANREEEDFFEILKDVTEKLDETPSRFLHADGADLFPNGAEQYYQIGAILSDNVDRNQCMQSMSPEMRQEYNEIPIEEIMWHVIPRDHLPDEGNWLEDLERAGADIISDFFEVCAPVEAEKPSRFRATFPINDTNPGINYSQLDSDSKSVRRVFVLHYSETHGLQCTKPESVSEDGTQATVVVDHFSWFGFIKSESMVLMMAYQRDYNHFSAMCCKESYFISEKDGLSILEYNDWHELLKNASEHVACKQQMYDQTEHFELSLKIQRSVQATQYLMKCLDSEYHTWRIVPVTSIFGNRGKYKYIFQDGNKEKIGESSEFKFNLECVAEDKDICDAEKERLKTFSLDIVRPIFGNSQKYGPYRIWKHQRHSPDVIFTDLTQTSLDSDPMFDVTDEPSLSFHSMHVGFYDMDAEEAGEQIIQHLQKKTRLLTHNELKKLISFLFRKENYEQCSTKQLQNYLEPLTSAPEQRLYYGKALVESWEKLQGDDSLHDALQQSRMRKLAVVLSSKRNRGNMTQAHCIEQQTRIEKTLEKENGYETIHVGGRMNGQPGELLAKHFDEALKILGEAILHPEDDGLVISVMVWIIGHGQEERDMGMIDVGAADFEEIAIARQKLQTDDNRFVDVTNFIEELGHLARSARNAKSPPFPIIVTNQFCRTHNGGGSSRGYIKDPPEDVFVIYACSSGQLAKDRDFVDQWLGKYVHDFKENHIQTTTVEVANIVAKLNQQKPRHKSNLEPKYMCKNGIYYDKYF